MRFLEQLAVGAGALAAVSCASPIQSERRDTQELQQCDQSPRRPAEIGLPKEVTPDTDPVIKAHAHELAGKVESCLDAKGGRISFTFSGGRRGILVEKVRPTIRNPATGIRLGEYVICKDDQLCWDFRHDPMPKNPS